MGQDGGVYEGTQERYANIRQEIAVDKNPKTVPVIANNLDNNPAPKQTPGAITADLPKTEAVHSIIPKFPPAHLLTPVQLADDRHDIEKNEIEYRQ